MTMRVVDWMVNYCGKGKYKYKCRYKYTYKYIYNMINVTSSKNKLIGVNGV